MRLRRQIPLTFYRQGELTENEYGQIVAGAATQIKVRGSLQPLGIGIQTKVLPEGYNESDARIFYTKTKILVDNVYNQVKADEVLIEGEWYKALDAGDWTTNLSRLSHYKVILVKKEPSAG